MHPIEEVSKVPIESVIGNYLTLTPEGSCLSALCPFHKDSGPTLKVNPGKQLYKCFACGSGGDGIRFVMEYLNIPFVEAVERIASDHDMDSKALHLLNALKELYTDLGYASDHLKNFLNERKISIETAEAFELGFAPDDNVVLNFLKQNDFSTDIALKLGLIREGRDGFFDTFRNRLIFPIIREDGKCVGFSGRAVLSETMPKYLNSVFDKDSLIVGLHLTKSAIQREKTVLIVEGYMDLVTLYEHGITNVVSTMGMALSPGSIKKLKQYASKFILGLDSDRTGKIATAKIESSLLGEGILARSINYYPWKDPVEFFCEEEHGDFKIRKKLEHAMAIIDHKILQEIFEFLEASLNERCQYLNKLFEQLRPLGFRPEATERVIRYSKLLQLETDTSILVEHYKAYLRNHS